MKLPAKYFQDYNEKRINYEIVDTINGKIYCFRFRDCFYACCYLRNNFLYVKTVIYISPRF